MKIGQVVSLASPYKCAVIVLEACQECPLEHMGLTLFDEKVIPKNQPFDEWIECRESSSSSEPNWYLDIYPIPNGLNKLCVINKSYYHDNSSSSSSSSSSALYECISYVEYNPLIHEIIYGPFLESECEFQCPPSEPPNPELSEPRCIPISIYNAELHQICGGPYYSQSQCGTGCKSSSSSSSSSFYYPSSSSSHYGPTCIPSAQIVTLPDGSLALNVACGSSSSQYPVRINSSSSSSSSCMLGFPPNTIEEYCPNGKLNLKIFFLPDSIGCNWIPVAEIYNECESSSSSCDMMSRYCLYSNYQKTSFSMVFSQEDKPPPCTYRGYCLHGGYQYICEDPNLGMPISSYLDYCCGPGICVVGCTPYYDFANCAVCGIVGGSWFWQGLGFDPWWKDNCECSGPCTYDGQCNDGCYCCDGYCRDTPCNCSVCCGLDQIVFSDPGDGNYPGATPAEVIFNYVDTTCPSSFNMPSSYQLYVVEMPTTSIAYMIFYCGDFAGEGRQIDLEIIEGDVIWQDITLPTGTVRRPSGQVLYRFAPNRLNAACCVNIDFKPTDASLNASNPCTATVTFRAGCAGSSSVSSDSPFSSSYTSQEPEPTNYICDGYSGCIQNPYGSWGSTLTDCESTCQKWWDCNYDGCSQAYYYASKLPWQYDDQSSCNAECKQYWSCGYYGCAQNWDFSTKYQGYYDDEPSCNLDCKMYWNCGSEGCYQNQYFSTKYPENYDDEPSCSTKCMLRFYCDSDSGCTTIGNSDNEEYFTDCSTNCFVYSKYCNYTSGCKDIWSTVEPETQPECPTCEQFWICSYGLPCQQSTYWDTAGLSQSEACSNCHEYFYCDNANGCTGYWALYQPSGMYSKYSDCDNACQERFYCDGQNCVSYGKYTTGNDQTQCLANCPSV